MYFVILNKLLKLRIPQVYTKPAAWQQGKRREKKNYAENGVRKTVLFGLLNEENWKKKKNSGKGAVDPTEKSSAQNCAEKQRKTGLGQLKRKCFKYKF